MLSAIGATERHLRLVMIANGLAVGVAATLAGTMLGFAVWFACVPTLQQATGHVVDATNLPWWAFAVGVVLAIGTSVVASRRPAKTMAAVPVVTALSGRPAPPKAVHRSALPGVIVFAGGLACLVLTGGFTGRGTGRDALLLLVGLPLAAGVGGWLLAGREPDVISRQLLD
jgi:putative ABC transport system permease protein